jgi:hypothetical protein
VIRHVSITVLLLAGCFEKAPGPEATSAEVPRVTLDVPAQLGAGMPLRVGWTIADATSGALVLRLRAPGTSTLARSAAGYFLPGSSPATGPYVYVAADGTTTDQRTALAFAPTGAIAVTLPSGVQGDWAVDAILLDATGRAMDVARKIVWIANGPQVKLDLSRTWAGTDDLVRASVTVRGTEAEQLLLSAWLTLPDDRVISLPGRQVGYSPVAEGEIAPGTFDLLSTELGRTYGPGRYAVSIKLETMAGVERARAGAFIRVCDELAMLRGTLAAPEGTSPAGFLTGIADDGRFRTGVIDEAGNFSIAVPPGGHYLMARGNGWLANTSAGEVGCGATRTVAITATADGFPAPRSVHEPSLPTPITFAAEDQPRRKRMLVVFLLDGVPVEERDDFSHSSGRIGSTNFTTALRNADSNIEFVDRTQQENIMADLGGLMQIGEDSLAETREALAAAGIFDGVVEFRANKDGGGHYTLVAKAKLGITAAEFRGITRTARSYDDIPDVLEGIARDLCDGLAAELEGRRDRPVNPDIDLFAQKSAYTIDEAVNIVVHVRETEPESPVAAATVEVEVLTPLGASLDKETVSTNAEGKAVATFRADIAWGAQFNVRAKMARNRGPIEEWIHGFQLRSVNAAMRSEKGILKPGESAPVLFDGRRLSSAAEIGLIGDNGSPDTPTLRLDGESRGSTSFTAGQNARRAKLCGYCPKNTCLCPDPTDTIGCIKQTMPMSNPFCPPPQTVAALGPPQETVVFGPLNFYVTQSLSISAFPDPGTDTLNDYLISIRGTVEREGDPLPNVEVGVSVTGEGEAFSSKTDAAGDYLALFHAPAVGMGSSVVKISAVFEGQVVEKDITFTYHPPCTGCPLLIEPNSDLQGTFISMRKGETRVFVPNKSVTWSMSGGAMQGNSFTAPQAGGVVHLNATAAENPSQTKRITIVVDCTLGEILGSKAGALTTVFGVPRGQADCGTLATRITPYMADGYQLAIDYGCPATFGGFGHYDERSSACTATLQVRDFLACSGNLLFMTIGPDLDTPGIAKRAVEIRQAEPPTPAGGTCVPVYHGRGVLQ